MSILSSMLDGWVSWFKFSEVHYGGGYQISLKYLCPDPNNLISRNLCDLYVKISV